MPDAVTTLVAVLIGGLLSYIVQARLDERKSKREAERDWEAIELETKRKSLAGEMEMRALIRLLLEELDTLALHHAMLAKAAHYPQERGPTGAGLLFPTDAWETDKRAFARGLTDSVWNSLSTFMHTVPRIRAIVAEAEPESAISSALVERFRKGALLASELHMMLSGVPAPSVNEHGEPLD